MKILELAGPGPLRDSGVSAILAGTKTAMTGLPAIYEKEGEPLPAAGERYSVIDSDGNPAAVIELTRVATEPIGAVGDAATATPPTGGPPTRTSSAATSWPGTSASCPTSTTTPSSSPSGSG